MNKYRPYVRIGHKLYCKFCGECGFEEAILPIRRGGWFDCTCDAYSKYKKLKLRLETIKQEEEQTTNLLKKAESYVDQKTLNLLYKHELGKLKKKYNIK